MEPEFITYQKFNDPALAEELAGQLEQHGIEHYVEEESLVFNPSFVLNDQMGKDYAVKIKESDFEKVNQLLRDDESKDVTEIGKDYYLYSFTDDELMDVITKADEWSPFDFVLARKILAKRGKDLSDKDIETISAKRIEALKVPEPPQTSWIVMGYVVAFMGGILGIFIGWHLMSHKKTLPDGERVYGYTENDRRQGKRIFCISIIVLAIYVGYRIITGVFMAK
jgi:hypothetical protein